MTDPVEALPAATVMVLRDQRRLEVLMVRRKSRGFFGGLMVFPGGAVDECDRGPLAKTVVSGDTPDHAVRAAALRELAEETAIAITAEGWVRSPSHRGPALYEELARASIRLAGERLVFVSRWVTPEMAPRRYDTRFYATSVIGDPVVVIDETELVSGEWVRPRVALERHEAGEWRMFTPTLSHLVWLGKHESAAQVMITAETGDKVRPEAPMVNPNGLIMPAGLPVGDEWK